MTVNVDPVIQEIIAEKLRQKSATSISEIANTEYTSSIPDDHGFNDFFRRMRDAAENHSYREIPLDDLKGRITKPIKRLIRHLVFWYVHPVTVQQTAFNHATSNAVGALEKQMNDNCQQLQQLKLIYDSTVRDIIDIKKTIEDLRDQIGAKDQQIRQLQVRNDNLEKQYINFTDNIHIRELTQAVHKIADNLLVRNEINKDETNIAKRDYQLSFSQMGEDTIIHHIFSVLDIKINTVRYLDLGANHAYYLSNTYSFYREGANGVLVEANPELANELLQKRPYDIILDKCIAPKSGQKIKFYLMNGDGLSTTDYDAAQAMIKENPALTIKQTVEVETISINDIADLYFNDKPPEILNIDLEGIEMEVLRSIDFTHFRPLIIICEMISYRNKLTIGEKDKMVNEYLHDKGYIEFAFTGVNSVFIDINSERVRQYGFNEKTEGNQ